MRVHFYTAYDSNKTIIGAANTWTDNRGHECITKRTYNRLMKHRTIGGCANIVPVETQVVVVDTNGNYTNDLYF